MARVAVGGTFDPLHEGHKALLMKACELCVDGELVVGLTSDEMAKNKTHEVSDYKLRYNEVMRFILARCIAPTIVKLDDPYGPTVNEDFDFIVVSPETHPVALKINLIRKEKGMKQIKIVLVECVLAEDGLPISSTRIRLGKIDEQGKLLEKKA